MVDCPTGFGLTPLWQRFDMVPIGGIITWSGDIATIPEKYQLCDGTNGTPNLTDKFICGAGTSYIPGQSGGTIAHEHTAESVEQMTPGDGPFVWVDVPASEESNLPPYFCLAHIQRMS